MRDLDAVLASIDGALDDLGTSGDAMRWSPEPATALCLCGCGQRSAGVILVEGRSRRAEVEVDLPPDSLGAIFAAVGEQVRRTAEQIARAFAEVTTASTEQVEALLWACRELDRPEPELDPRARALAHVRQRHNGPHVPPAGRSRRPRHHGARHDDSRPARRLRARAPSAP